MHFLILNGPNLNLLGTREPGVYGDRTFEDYLSELKEIFPVVEFEYFQSNIEGELIDALHQAMGRVEGVILNAGGYTHTSVAIADAIQATGLTVVEVHISNIHAREDFRQVSLTARNCIGSITGFGLLSYRLAIEAL
ncbi:MAG: type II 3-dehydroquinate dehydratase, partial [Bacteroidota bacterium]